MHLDDLHALLGHDPSSSPIRGFLTTLSGSSSITTPEIRAYPDVIYHNYYDLGVSLCYVPSRGKTIPTNPGPGELKLDTIDIYHVPASDRVSARPGRIPKPTFGTFGGLPIEFPVVPLASGSSSSAAEPKAPSSTPNSASASTSASTTTQSETLSLSESTVGKDLVKTLGEPSKKGGGQYGMDVYLEWASLGVQIDLKDRSGGEMTDEQKKKGMGGVWDKAAGWGWGCLKVFEKMG